MKLKIAAAFALTAASSLHAQTAAPAPATPAPTVDLEFATPAQGTWFYSQTPGGSEAAFRSSALAQLTIRCTRSTRVVSISKPASAAAPFMLVWTSTQARSLPASFDPATGQVSARVNAFDPLLDAVSFSRGRFGVNVSGSPVLVVPAWAETTRVIEDCRV